MQNLHSLYSADNKQNGRENIHYLCARSVNDPWKPWKEAGEVILHLLGGELGVAVLQILALHKVSCPRHLAHHDWVGLHEIERAFLDDGRLFSLAKSYGHFERICLWQVGD